MPEQTAAGRPYAPSWIDRLTERVGALPVPAWGFYLVLALILELIAVGALVLGGMLNEQHALTYYTWPAVSVAYLIGLVHYLDNWAGAALARFRPVLAVDEAGYERLRYQLTTLPARPTLAASGLGALYGVANLAWSFAQQLNPNLAAVHPAVIALDIVYRVLAYLVAATALYHTFHQMRTVSAIYTGHTRINLFQPGPLYALSGLAARGAIGIGVLTYLWLPPPVSMLPNQALTLADFLPAIFLAAVIMITFVWPLLGAHRLLEREKQRLHDEVGARLQATLTDLHEAIDRGDLEPRGDLANTLAGLKTAQEVIDKLRTWPWRVGTASGIAVAILAPILIWLIQRLLERLGI